MTMHCYERFCLVGVMLLALSPAASAKSLTAQQSSLAARADGDTSVPILLAQGWSFGSFFSGGGGRTRVVQFCVVTMGVALFIMMRKISSEC
jgi:hypothetical protein